ncbi:MULTISPECIES: RNA polymerase sigma factor SigJ [Nocardioides]|uniref:RNA polymerase sigma factor SigJ n=1 Tax=Nocardioides vastitatis TaxID=2568655 RepID=A0ABW0Z8K4_9ACTN|nr:RNA polymerase sigma factor SigJ [Nocardioides sp.]THI96178.1 sigma-70 family RNA polymerase sigma factor [Nocardioides sp.]
MDDLDVVMAERRRLIALAYRMFGTLEEAEDAVQETYLRWYRLTEEERAAIGNPQGWLTRVASRICLDVLKSARARREQYVGEWLPEPVPAGLLGDGSALDPVDRVTLDDTVSTALLVVLDAMTPAERVAFVLHDVFALPFPEIAEIVGRSPAAVRQLATSARRRVADHRDIVARPGEHDAVVRAFVAAAAGGNLDALTALLDPSVTLYSDGGGVVSAARKPVVGPTRVARFLVGVLRKRSTWAVVERVTADGLGLTLTDNGEVRAVLNVRVVGGLVTDVWMVVNPGKLTGWR